MHSEEVIKFWFEESSPRQWFAKSKEFDEEIRSRFLETYHQVVAGKTKEWRTTPEGRLAEILVLDQFARNMFRDTPQAFEHDALAFSLAHDAVKTGADKRLDAGKRYFLYMPYMHNESRAAHKQAIWFFLRLPMKEWRGWLTFEYRHKSIIDRFGRYPHRNKILGRVSTPEELAFMEHNKGF